MNTMHHYQTNPLGYYSGGVVARTPAAGVRKARQVTSSSIKRGRWEHWEKVAFLMGLRKHGRGRWKLIASCIPSRTTIQVKTHAQVVLKKADNGINIFACLYDDDDASTEGSDSSIETSNTITTPWSTRTPKPKPVMTTKWRPLKTLHMTPNTPDFEAAEVLAALHAPGPYSMRVDLEHTLSTTKHLPNLVECA